MNKVAIIGILLFGIGILLISPLIGSSLSIGAGIIAQILGLFLTTKGAIINRKQVVQDSEGNLKNYFESEIKEFRQELSAAKKVEENEKLVKIENKFDEWAKEFESNKNLKVLELSRDAIKEKEHEELLNKNWITTYRTIFSTLNELLKAYSKLPSSDISKIEFPTFPSNIISKQAANYFAKVHISGHYLYISLNVRKPTFKNIIPDIVFKIDKEDRELDKGPMFYGELNWYSDSRLIFEIDSDPKWIFWSKGESKFEEDVIKYQIPDSQKEWEKNLKKVVEYVIAKSEVKFKRL